jgi:hypothetical protein
MTHSTRLRDAVKIVVMVKMAVRMVVKNAVARLWCCGFEVVKNAGGRMEIHKSGKYESGKVSGAKCWQRMGEKNGGGEECGMVEAIMAGKEGGTVTTSMIGGRCESGGRCERMRSTS